MKHLFKKLAAVLAALVLLSGCRTDTSWAYYHEYDVMPSGVYLSYLISSYNTAVGRLLQEEAAAGPGSGGKSVVEMSQKEIYRLQLEGMAVSDWMIQNAQREARSYFAVKNKLSELGHNVSQFQIDYISSMASSSIQENPGFFRNNGISENSLALSYINEAAREELFGLLYGPGGQMEVTQAELEEHFTANYGKAEYMFFEKVSAFQMLVDGAIDDLKVVPEDEQIERVQRYFARMKAGESIHDLILARNIEDLEAGEDPDTLERRASEFTLIVSENDVGYIDETVIRGILDVSIGQSELLETENYYFVFKRVATDEDDFEQYRDDLLQELRRDEFIAKLDEWGAALPIVVNPAAISRYVPSKLTFPKQ